jgi:iron complex outermembrane receptor protein
VTKDPFKAALLGTVLLTSPLLATRAIAQDAPATAQSDEAAATPKTATEAAPEATSPAVSTDAKPAGAELPEVVVEEAPRTPDTPVKKAARRKSAVAAQAQAAKQTAPGNSAPAASANQTPMPMEPASDTAQDAPATLANPISGTVLTQERLQQLQSRTSDTASMLSSVAGVSIAQGGGVSGLPALNGLADDRVKIIINGRETTSACGNHMNPPLSYADPGQVKSVRVTPGTTSVSEGGDSIAGTIVVETLPPSFAEPGGEAQAHASISTVYRSNGNGISTSASAHAAAGNMSLGYTGAFTRADNYEDGSGREIGSTLYEAHNHTLALAARHDGDVYMLEGGFQYIPYQGFVNQPMDMVLNESFNVAGRYEGTRDWGKISFITSYQHIRHGMNFLEDKQRSFEAAGWGANAVMPMNTLGDEGGYVLKSEIRLSDADTLRLGNELHLQRLDDRWPPVCSTPFCGMGPDTYVNINDGERDRIGTFIEWERVWDRSWSTLLGVRNDVVRMDTGDVQPYESIDGDIDTAAAEAFNAKDRRQTDVNFDATALVRYEATRELSLEAGASRKTRSPNLYERYAWGESSMTSQMTTWFGDSNGYVGNIDLEPEIAYRLSFTAALHDAAREHYEFKVTPFYTYVDDFITAELVSPGWASGFNLLKFINHDAVLYGVDIAGRALLGETDFGRFFVSGVASYVHGEDQKTGGPLYHMMPWNGRIALEHRAGGFTNVAEVEMVAAKTRVDEDRLEPVTDGYALLNLRTSYTLDDVRFDAGVDNVFDTLYFAPLGGTNYTDYLLPGNAVAGTGRSIFAGVTVNF